MSTAYHRSRSPTGLSSNNNIRRTQNVAAKAAAQRLALVMATQNADLEEDGDDDDHHRIQFAPPSPLPYYSNNGRHSSSLGRKSVETPAGRPSPPLLIPPRELSLRPPVPVQLPVDPSTTWQREKGFLPETGHLKINTPGSQHEAAALQDELDMLQEENETFLDKLRLAEERRQRAEARTMELEKQVAALGEGASLETKLLSRKEAALRQREVALKAAQQFKDGRDEEIESLRSDIENIKDDTAATIELIHKSESETKAHRSMKQRMILTQEEMEEVVLKRCWLARYWGLAVQHGICMDIAVTKYEHWSSLAPLPFEVVMSAGQKAKEELPNKCDSDPEERGMLGQDLSDLTGEGYIESMLSVEMGLRELEYLKIEDAVMLALTQSRRPGSLRQSISDPKPGDLKYMEAFELGEEESDDVLFKEAWLTYIWRRAKTHGLELDIAEERLKFWIDRSSGQSPTSHDIINVAKGLMELKKLGIEQQLWEISRKRN
ncbi:hypothetical protein ACHQM5_010456 [Ranunculus cassubicifolius]